MQMQMQRWLEELLEDVPLEHVVEPVFVYDLHATG